MVLREKLYTVEEFWEIAALPENADKRLELYDGEIVEMAASTRINTITGMRVGTFLNNFVIPRDLGYVTGADGGFKLGAKHARHPDTAFIAKGRVDGLVGVNFEVAPELAVEIVSPDEDIFTKAREYLHAGTKLVWAIYTDERLVYVFTMDDDAIIHSQPFSINDTLSGGDVLPGFMLPVRDIFP